MAIGKQIVEDVLPEYTMDHLGTSFKVVLVNSVKRHFDLDTGKSEIVIPDYQGLMKVIAISRASDPNKLKSGDIRFLRKTLGLRAKDLAEKLDVSAEHLSRCESGERVLSANSEKVLRLLVLLEPLYVLEKASETAPENMKNVVAKIMPLVADIRGVISDMKIAAAHDANDELVLRFCHGSRQKPRGANDPADEDNISWEQRNKTAEAA